MFGCHPAATRSVDLTSVGVRAPLGISGVWARGSPLHFVQRVAETLLQALRTGGAALCNLHPPSCESNDKNEVGAEIFARWQEIRSSHYSTNRSHCEGKRNGVDIQRATTIQCGL